MGIEISKIARNGYANCIELNNGIVKVVIEPDCGGRVLEYSVNGQNVLYINPLEDGYLLESGQPPLSNLSPCAGRLDIGPEMTIDPHPVLWLGRYSVSISESGSVTLTSAPDQVTGTQLIRTFTLAENSSHLSCTQVIRNITSETKKYFHWSRTFAVGGGIAIVPLNNESRYPKKYIMYGPGDVMDYMPSAEKNVVVADGLLQIIGAPSRAKFAIDSFDGWLAYQSKNNCLFVKKFPTAPERLYGEMASNTISIWYNQDIMCELEPIGPIEVIEPGSEVSYTEDWWLFERQYNGECSIAKAEIESIISKI